MEQTSAPKATRETLTQMAYLQKRNRLVLLHLAEGVHPSCIHLIITLNLHVVPTVCVSPSVVYMYLYVHIYIT